MKRLWILMLVLVMMAMPALAIGENTPTPDAPTTPLSEEEALNLAADQYFGGDFDAAIATLSTLLDQTPDSVQALILRAEAYQAIARPTLALDDLTRAIVVAPYAWELLVSRGDLYYNQREAGEAITDYNRAIDLNPRYGDAYARLADIYSLQGSSLRSQTYFNMSEGAYALDAENLNDAIADFDRVIASTLDDDTLKAYAYYSRALANFLRGNEREALADASSATEYYRDMHDIYLLRGTIYRNQGDLLRAGADYARRIELLTQFTEVLPANENAQVAMTYGKSFSLSFDATAGEVITLSAQDANASEVDALIAVLDPQGNAIAGDDDTGAGAFSLDAEVTIEIPTDGNYTLLISHANGGYFGLLDVTITR